MGRRWSASQLLLYLDNNPLFIKPPAQVPEHGPGGNAGEDLRRELPDPRAEGPGEREDEAPDPARPPALREEVEKQTIHADDVREDGPLVPFAAVYEPVAERQRKQAEAAAGD